MLPSHHPLVLSLAPLYGFPTGGALGVAIDDDQAPVEVLAGLLGTSSVDDWASLLGLVHEAVDQSTTPEAAAAHLLGALGLLGDDALTAEGAASASLPALPSAADVRAQLTVAVKDAFDAQRAVDLLPPELKSSQVTQALTAAVQSGSITNIKGLVSSALAVAGGAGGAALCAATGVGAAFAPLCAAAGAAAAKALVSIADGAHGTTYTPADPKQPEYYAIATLRGSLTVDGSGDSPPFTIYGSTEYDKAAAMYTDTLAHGFSLFANDDGSAAKIKDLLDHYFAPEPTIEEFLARFGKAVPYYPTKHGQLDPLQYSLDGLAPFAAQGTRRHPDKGGSFQRIDTFEWTPVEPPPDLFNVYGLDALNFTAIPLGFGFMLPFVPPEILLGIEVVTQSWDGVSWATKPLKGKGLGTSQPGQLFFAYTCDERCSTFPYGVGDKPALWAARYYDAIGAVLEQAGIPFAPQVAILKSRISSLIQPSYWLQRLAIYNDLKSYLYPALSDDMQIRLQRAYTAAALQSQINQAQAVATLTALLVQRTGCDSDACRTQLHAAAVTYAQQTQDEGAAVVTARIEKDYPLGSQAPAHPLLSRVGKVLGYSALAAGALAAGVVGLRVHRGQPPVPPVLRAAVRRLVPGGR